MTRHSQRRQLVQFMAGLWMASVCLGSSGALPGSPEAFFTPDQVWNIHLSVASNHWDAMMPENAFPPGPLEKDGRPGFFRPGPPHPPLSGEDYPYVHARLEIEGKVYPDIGLRYKGNSSFRSSTATLKRPFKLDFNHYVEGEKFLGLTQLNLNNNAMDGSQIREALAYGLFRKAGVPASRTTFARVWLTVPGRYERRLLGLYTVVEEVNKAFLKEQFQSAKGLLLKPTRANNLPYLGEAWANYEKVYDPKTSAHPEQTRQIMALARLVQQAPDEDFDRQVATLIEAEGFTRFVAVNALLANLDSFLGTGHNFYLYVHPETGRIHWIPWDLNHAFGGFPGAGSAERQMRLSLEHPWTGRNRLLERWLAQTNRLEAYRDFCRSFVSRHFTAAKLHEEMDRLARTIQGALAEEKQAGIELPRGPMGRQAADMDGLEQLKALAARRAESVADQLAGRAAGLILDLLHGPPPILPPDRPGLIRPRPPRSY